MKSKFITHTNYVSTLAKTRFCTWALFPEYNSISTNSSYS